jgi:hypothetical protein
MSKSVGTGVIVHLSFPLFSVDRNLLPVDLAIQRFGDGSGYPSRAFVITDSDVLSNFT